MYKTLAMIGILTLTACASQKPAQIVMHNGSLPQTQTPSSILPDDGIPFIPVFGEVKQSQPAPVKEMTIKELVVPEKRPRSDAGQIEIRKDDTLFSLARRQGIPAKDLAEANNLQAPYDLSGMTTLRLPEYAIEQAAASTPAAVVASHAPIPRFRPELTRASAILQENDGFKPFAVRPQFNSKGKFIWPVAGKVISRFGAKSGGLYNDGVNIAAPEGASIYASMDGTVVYAGDELASYGNLLILRHNNGWLTAYAHTKEIMVKKGQKVKLGQVIALVGQTGNVKTPQIHFGIRDGKKPLDPVLKVRG